MTRRIHFSKISDYHQFAQIPGPDHPLISLVDYSQVRYPEDKVGLKLIQNYFTIGLKRNVPYKLYYGQKEYDFDGGLMTFVAPNQVIGVGDNPNVMVDEDRKPSGWLLFIHPDFLWNYPLAQKILSYDFFGYEVHEALFLSEKEENAMVEMFKNIEREYQSNLDSFSQKIIISHLELLLNYAERFYQRQFLTRTGKDHSVLGDLDLILKKKLEEGNLIENGLPTVDQIAQELHFSPNYLSALLKSLTGMNTQQHIHQKLIEKAKEQLSLSSLNISEIAYSLGFERPASFTKLFKSKTDMSPLEFRKSFN